MNLLKGNSFVAAVLFVTLGFGLIGFLDEMYENTRTDGFGDELIEKIMQKPITEMQELYNTRDIEK